MTKKQGIRAVVFLIVLLAVLWWLDAVIRFSPDFENLSMARRFNEMYTDTGDTWDGILLGTSFTDRSWAAPYAFEQYGMAVYPMSSDSQPFALAPNVIEEVLKRQDISFAALELHGLTKEAIWTDPVKVRRITDNMRRSLNWVKTIDDGIKYMQKWHPDALKDDPVILRLSYYFPIVQFHSRLMTENLSAADFVPGATEMKGVYEDRSLALKTGKAKLKPHEEDGELSAEQKELMDRVFACAEKNGIDLVFYSIPSQESRESYQKDINAAASYALEHGYPVLNCNDAETLAASGLNGKSDYYDTGHMNIKGARKFTDFFAAFLETVFADSLVDHRGDVNYLGWEKAAAVYDKFYEESIKEMDSGK